MEISDQPFAPGAVVRVPFPYTDAGTRQHRPALVVAGTGSEPEPFLLWVVMITSAAHRGWPGDVDVPPGPETGLPAPSIIRTAKIATVDRSRAECRGRLAPETLAEALRLIAARLGLDGDRAYPT